MAVADLTGDGKLDIITTNELQDTVTVQLGNGDGTFEPGQAVAVGPAPTAVAVADLNGDGRPDLVTADSGRRLRERAPWAMATAPSASNRRLPWAGARAR